MSKGLLHHYLVFENALRVISHNMDVVFQDK